MMTDGHVTRMDEKCIQNCNRKTWMEETTWEDL